MASSSSSFSPPTNVNHTKNNDLRRQDDIAIDFQKLRKEEKKRAIREKKKRQQQMIIVEPPPPPPGGVPPSPEHQGTSRTNTISPPSVGAPALNNNNKDWPKDWLSSSSWTNVSTLFTPDYICTKPDTVTYKRDFLSTKQCHELRDWLLSLPSSSSSNDTTKQRGEEEAAWNTMTFAKRRVLLFEDGDLSPLPLPLQQLSQLLVRLHIFPSSHPPNHVLVNEYTGNQGIMAHTDGPLYYPKTATLSIGNSVLLYFQKRLATHEIGQVETNPVERQVLLENKSLVVFEKEAYTNYCHGIDDAVVLVEYASPVCLNAPPETRVTRGHRISLTFRHKYNM
jgi:hypothetical protein